MAAMRTVITVVAAFLIVANIEGTAAVSGVTTFNDVCSPFIEAYLRVY